MRSSVSNRRAGVVTLAVSMSVVWLVFVLNGFPWSGLLWVSLAFSTTFWVATDSTRAIANVIDNIEAGPVQAIAAPVPSAPQMERGHSR